MGETAESANIVRLAAETIAAALVGDEDTAARLSATAAFDGTAPRVLHQVVNQLSQYCEPGAELSEVLDQARQVAMHASARLLDEDPAAGERWQL